MECGLIGERLGHSFSKLIHAELADYGYELYELPPDELEDFIKNRDFSGINVTIPYKEAVIPLLDEIDDRAREIGAVNTVVNRNGKLKGYNTDAQGMISLIRKNDITIDKRKVLILGTGGTSKTAMYVAKSLGAREVYKVSRSGNDGALTYEEVYAHHTDAEVIINTTPAGMFPNTHEIPINIAEFHGLTGVVDVIFNPLHTSLVVSAKQAGIRACGGLYMLVAQAAYASAYFTGKEAASESDIDRIYDKLLRKLQNIVLIGMPSSGKTTVGRELAKKLNLDFADTDEFILEKIRMPIAEYFDKYGEAAFRKVENEVIEELAIKQGLVIATGGGAVLDPKNVAALKRNGLTVFIDRPLDSLICTSDRPLSSDPDKLKKLYETRYPIYNRYADITIDGNFTISENVRNIISKLQ